jgi:3-methyladenine DNA glycosylase AlkD
MNQKQVMAELEGLGDAKIRAHYRKAGAGENLFGVKLGDIRKLAKKLKGHEALAHGLWDTGNVDARFVAILLFQPKDLSIEDMERLVHSIEFDRVADWFNAYLLKKHPDNETLRLRWMESEHPMAARSGWDATYIRVGKKPGELDTQALLDRIEAEMGVAAPAVQWTMNFTLAAIGIHCPKLRKRALAIGESIGLYREYPVSKGCTSPFAPIWINEMVGRQK